MHTLFSLNYQCIKKYLKLIVFFLSKKTQAQVTLRGQKNLKLSKRITWSDQKCLTKVH